MLMVFSIAVLFILYGAAVFYGNVLLLPEQIQKRVKDKAGYGRAMGSLMIALGLVIFAAGILAFFGKGADSVSLAIRLLLTALILAILLFIRIQIKYNGRISG